MADVDGDFATEIIVPRTPSGGCPAVDPIFPNSGTFVAKTGFIIYRDPMDRWANSRPVWNQHAYYITHITDDARVPPASEALNNWQVPELRAGKIDLQAEVCNRGTNPVQDGVVVQFLETTDPNQPIEDAKVVCETMTTKLLLPGQCEIVGCTADLQGAGNLYVDVDPEDKIADCHPGNNFGADALGLCPG